ncbi:MAG: hypothetical protein U9R08_03080 [Nanoarchaeota archaeon]|nr:hypothetical protein [Nanoarchaeota archaeon]
MFKKTFQNMKDKFVLLPVATDIIFILLFGFVFEFIRNRVAVELQNIVKIIGSSSIEIAPGIFSYSTLIENLKQMPGFTGSFNAIIVNIILMFILMFILWVSLESVSWWTAYKLNKIKIKFNDFLKKFFLKSIIYFVIALVTMFAVMRVALGITLKGDIVAGEGIFILFWIILFAIFVFLFVSYSRIDKKFNIKNWKVLILGVVGFLILIGLDKIAKLIAGWNYILMLIFGLVIILPYLTYFRMYLINHENKKS